MDFSARPLDEKELLRRLLGEKEEAPKSEEDSVDAPESAEEEGLENDRKKSEERDVRSKAIEQRILEGIYRGDFGKVDAQGCQTILQNHKVKKTDLEEKEYILQVQMKPLLSKE